MRISISPFGDLILYGTVPYWTNAWPGIYGEHGQVFETALSSQRHDWQILARDFPHATLIVAGDLIQNLVFGITPAPDMNEIS